MREDKGKFYPIPSLGNKYEINRRKVVRNGKTKRQLKVSDGCVCFQLGKKDCRKSIRSLLWEVFGIIPKGGLKGPKKVIVTKGKQVFRFDSFKKCAEFLSPRIFFAENSLRSFLSRRVEKLGEYYFRYP